MRRLKRFRSRLFTIPEESEGFLPPSRGRIIRSRYRPHSPDFEYLKFRDALYDEYLQGAKKIKCPNAQKKKSCGLKNCPFFHGSICNTCGAVLHSSDAIEILQHEIVCHPQYYSPQCMICNDIIGVGQGRKSYGLLSGCNHPFCYDCIRIYRQNYKSKNCPVCNNFSDCCIPSAKWMDTKEKTDMFSSYTSGLY